MSKQNAYQTRRKAEKYSVRLQSFLYGFSLSDGARFPQAIISNAHPHPAKLPRPRQRPFSSDFLRLSAEKVFFIRFPQAIGRKSFFRAISSGFWPKKFFSSNFLRLLAEKVFFKRFPQAIGPKSFFRAIASGFRSKEFQAISSGNHLQCTPASGQISPASAADFRCSRRG